MKKFMMLWVAGALIAGTAHAQAPRPNTQPAPQQQQQQQSHGVPGKGTPAKASANRYPTPPKHWGKRSTKAWQRHVDRCQKNYRSYNPRTDRYSYRGRNQLCRL